LTPAVVVMAVGLLLLGGLVTDGGRQLNAQMRAQATAEEAARAGAAALKPFEAAAVVDREGAYAAVGAYCDQAADHDDTISTCQVADVARDAGTDTWYVSVRVRTRIDALLFGIIGVHSLDSDATARASAVLGVNDPTDELYAPGLDVSVSYKTPTITIDPPSDTGGPDVTSVPLPSQYVTTPANPCDSSPVTLDVTQSVTCTTSEVTSTVTNTQKTPPKTKTVTSPTTATQTSSQSPFVPTTF
jgi:hypothetical protein